ncbi:unnamed protein product [Owenia fusiformis]|uniref:Uncharacterized protein n=1 Tax=Owenia fusiformis TaxID=6347 RepID=A0A8J1XUV3_OWEFU|nr:unnamed protein product [Owenia fusiformis]
MKHNGRQKVMTSQQKLMMSGESRGSLDMILEDEEELSKLLRGPNKSIHKLPANMSITDRVTLVRNTAEQKHLRLVSSHFKREMKKNMAAYRNKTDQLKEELYQFQNDLNQFHMDDSKDVRTNSNMADTPSRFYSSPYSRITPKTGTSSRNGLLKPKWNSSHNLLDSEMLKAVDERRNSTPLPENLMALPELKNHIQLSYIDRKNSVQNLSHILIPEEDKIDSDPPSFDSSMESDEQTLQSDIKPKQETMDYTEGKHHTDNTDKNTNNKTRNKSKGKRTNRKVKEPAESPDKMSYSPKNKNKSNKKVHFACDTSDGGYSSMSSSPKPTLEPQKPALKFPIILERTNSIIPPIMEKFCILGPSHKPNNIERQTSDKNLKRMKSRTKPNKTAITRKSSESKIEYKVYYKNPDKDISPVDKFREVAQKVMPQSRTNRDKMSMLDVVLAVKERLWENQRDLKFGESVPKANHGVLLTDFLLSKSADHERQENKMAVEGSSQKGVPGFSAERSGRRHPNVLLKNQLRKMARNRTMSEQIEAEQYRLENMDVTKS